MTATFGLRWLTLGFTMAIASTLCIAADTSPAQNPAWANWDRDTLGRAYNSSAAVPESAAIFKGWIERSQALRAQHPQHLDLVYGPRERDKIDYFSAGSNTPVLVFIHGGFWQMRSKDDFAFLAQHFLEQRISVAMVGYPLAPESGMDEIVADTRSAIRYLAGRLPELGGDPHRMVVTGWSSGGHLATMVLDEPSVRSGVAISGLYELEPLLNSYVNDKLKMDKAVAQRNSPRLHLPRHSKELLLFSGDAELSEIRRQSSDYFVARKAAGLPVEFIEIPGANHYTILNSMADVNGRIHTAMVALLRP